MPTIEVETAAGASVRFECPGGGRLLDACDAARAPVPFSCRSASCGTCLVDVLAGGDLLEQPGADEIGVLAIVSRRPGQRLACQAVVRRAAGRVVVRPA